MGNDIKLGKDMSFLDFMARVLHKVNEPIYSILNCGIYCSFGLGASRSQLKIPWAKECCLQHPWVFEVME